jgi:hypothetical protein
MNQLKFGAGSAPYVSANPHREKMVEALERYMKKNPCVNITGMGLAGHKQPKSVNGSIPDVEAVESLCGQPVFGKAEECDSYADDRTRVQLEAFSRVQNSTVYLAVPASCFAAAESYIKSKFGDRNITVLSYDEK